MALHSGKHLAGLVRNVGWRMAWPPACAAFCNACCSLSSIKAIVSLYATPAFVMLGLHAVLASFYTRYNLVLDRPIFRGGRLPYLDRCRECAFATLATRSR